MRAASGAGVADDWGGAPAGAAAAAVGRANKSSPDMNPTYQFPARKPKPKAKRLARDGKKKPRRNAV